MATTKLNDIINPEVMGNMIEAKINAQNKLIPYAKVDDTLEGVPGDTKTVPSWNYIGDAEDFNPETAADTDSEMSTTKLTAGSTTFTIKCAGKSVSILQTAINSGLGDPVGQANIQLAKSINGKIDNDLLAAAYSTPNVLNASGAAIGYAGIVDANAKFEDEEDGVEKVMFIHPQQEATLLKDGDFLSADKFTSGVAVNGAIGKIAGAWVKKSLKVKKHDAYVKNAGGTITIVNDQTAEDATHLHLASVLPYSDQTVAVGDKVNAVTDGVWLNPIIKMEPDSADTEYTEDELPALTIFLKKNTQVDHEWFPKKQRHDITAAKYYGVALTNASKVVVAAFSAVATV